jgi:hypothetical protein
MILPVPIVDVNHPECRGIALIITHDVLQRLLGDDGPAITMNRSDAEPGDISRVAIIAARDDQDALAKMRAIPGTEHASIRIAELPPVHRPRDSRPRFESENHQ